MNLRKYARGKQCMIRYPGCSYNPEETVLAHLRTHSTGMGTKENDLFAAWSCNNCNMISDGQIPPPEGWTKAEVRCAFYEGIWRTMKQLIADGVLHVGNNKN